MSETETYPVQQVAARQKTMRAVALDRFGGPEVLRVQTIPVPEVGPDEILIEIEAAGVGPWDPSEREGELAQWSGIAPKFPYIPGSDGAGTVVAVGKEVRGFREGDSVYALSFVNPKGGFYAEYTAVKTDGASLIPGDLTIEQAGAMPVDAITALRGLEDLLNLQAGESVLILGASGGVGHLAVQLAKRMGARVFAVASGDDGVEFVRRLGADAVVDGHKDDVTAVAHEFAPDGLDAALLVAGGEAAERALTALREGGRATFPYGVRPELRPRSGVTIHQNYNATADPQLIERLNRLIESGPFEVHIARTFPLEQAAEAHRTLKTHYLGKLVLRPR
jgi:NADPH2:quinone reductase